MNPNKEGKKMALKRYGLKVMVIGGLGGREAVIVWRLSKSPRVAQIYLSGRSDSLEHLCTCCNLGDDVNVIADFAKKEGIDLAFVGPEKHLSLGVVDAFEARRIPIVGPSQEASRLESSKCDTKMLLQDLCVPVPEFAVFDDPEKAKKYVRDIGYPVVVKADGLAAGKGSIVCSTTPEAEDAIDLIMIKRQFGDAGNRVIIEKRVYGRELSFFCFTDGIKILPMEGAQDYKGALDGNQGKNTGGMGSFSPHPWLDDELTELIMSQVARPTINGLRDICRIKYKGVIYFGLMLVEEGDKIIPYVLEINVRLGDPEAQVILPRLENDLVDILEAIYFERLGGINLLWSPDYCLCLCATSGRSKAGPGKGWNKGYPDRYGIGFPITGLDKVDSDCLVFHSGTKKNDEGQFETAGGRALALVTKKKSLMEARVTAYNEMSKISFTGITFRTDIGKE
jgi:phosphoribosylamine---glycine ligase